MSGTARRAAAATVIATTLVVSATASASPPPTLTGKFPLGTKTLSHSSSTPAPKHSQPAPKQPTPTPKHSQTAAKQPTPTPKHSSTTPATTHRQAASKGTLIVIAVALAILLIGFVDWVVVRGSHRTDPRRRRRIPRGLRSLPRRNGVRVSPPDEDDTDGDGEPAADAPLLPIMPGPAQPTPDPFQPRSPNRTPPRHDDRNGAQDEQTPKPVIRSRQS
jgi:hypothetical protein